MGAGGGGGAEPAGGVCRICLEECGGAGPAERVGPRGGPAGAWVPESEDGQDEAALKELRVLKPCKCLGTQGLVHFGCLKSWTEFQLSKGRRPEEVAACPVCKGEYVLPRGYSLGGGGRRYLRLPSKLSALLGSYRLRLALTRYAENMYIIHTVMRALNPVLALDLDLDVMPASSALVLSEALDQRMVAAKAILTLSVPFLPAEARRLFGRLMEAEGLLALKDALLSGPFLRGLGRVVGRFIRWTRRRPPPLPERRGL